MKPDQLRLVQLEQQILDYLSLTSWRPLRVVWYHWTVDVLGPPFSPLFLLPTFNRTKLFWTKKHNKRNKRRVEKRREFNYPSFGLMRFVHWIVWLIFFCFVLLTFDWNHSITISVVVFFYFFSGWTMSSDGSVVTWFFLCFFHGSLTDLVVR